MGNCFLTPSQPFRLYQGETQFIKSQVKVFSQFPGDSSQSVRRGFGENEVERTGKAEIACSRLEATAVGKACYECKAIYYCIGRSPASRRRMKSFILTYLARLLRGKETFDSPASGKTFICAAAVPPRRDYADGVLCQDGNVTRSCVKTAT